MKAAFLSIFLLFFFSLPAFQQNTWTLEQCITYALQNNLQVKIQENNTRYYQNSYTQSILNILPNLNASGGFASSSGRALDQTTYQFSNKTINSVNANINSSMTLFNGFNKLNTIQENRYKVLAGIQELQKFKNDMALNLALAYLQLLLNNELLDVNTSQLEISKLQLTHTQQLYDAGSIPQSNFLQVQSQLATDELNLVNAQNQVDISLLNLKQMLDLDTMKNFNIVKPDFSNFPIADITTSVDEIYQQALSNLPEIKQAEYTLKSSEKGLNVARSGRSPSLSLSYSYGSAYSDINQRVVGTDPVTHAPIYGKYPFKNQFADNTSSTISIGASIPIFNGWMVNTNISNAKIGVSTSVYQLQIARMQLYKNIQQAQTDAIAAFKGYNASDNAVKSSEESFRSISQKFDLGLVNFVDYSTSKNQLLLAKSNLLQAKYNYIFKSKVLEFYKNGQVKL